MHQIKKYLKIIFFIIIVILSFAQSTLPSGESVSLDSENTYEDVLAKYDKINKKIILEGITYDLKVQEINHSEEPGYKTMNTNEIMFSLIYIFGNKIY